MRRLDEITDELERAVFLSVYHSRRQKWRRRIAMLALVLKHVLRGLLLIWPAYLVLLLLMSVPGMWNSLYFLLLMPGLLVWLFIYTKGAKLDYSRQVNGQLLGKGFLKHIMMS